MRDSVIFWSNYGQKFTSESVITTNGKLYVRQIWTQTWLSLKSRQAMTEIILSLSNSLKIVYGFILLCGKQVPQICHLLSCFSCVKSETAFYSCQATGLSSPTPVCSPLQGTRAVSAPSSLCVPSGVFAFCLIPAFSFPLSTVTHCGAYMRHVLRRILH